MARKSTKRWWSTGVVVLGALATIATSAPQEQGVRGERSFELAPYEVALVEVTFDEVAMNHARRFPEVTRLRLETRVDEGLVTTVADDGSMPPVEGSTSLIFGLDACPEEGACTLGLSLEETLGASAVVVLSGALSTDGDPRFLLPEARDYPAGATVTVRRAP